MPNSAFDSSPACAFVFRPPPRSVSRGLCRTYFSSAGNSVNTFRPLRSPGDASLWSGRASSNSGGISGRFEKAVDRPPWWTLRR